MFPLPVSVTRTRTGLPNTHPGCNLQRVSWFKKSIFRGSMCGTFGSSQSSGRGGDKNKQPLFSKALGQTGKKMRTDVSSMLLSQGHMTHVSYCFPGCLTSSAETRQATRFNCGWRELFYFCRAAVFGLN